MDAQTIIKKLNLIPLPEEGGFFRETYRDPGLISTKDLPHLEGERSYSTCIYYLITPEEFSGLHAVKSTEIFHFYAGDPVEMVQIDPLGKMHKEIIGSSLTENHKPQVIVSPNVWQGTKLLAGGKWALLGCTVAPGFDIRDFSGGSFSELSKKFPEHSEVIKNYTHI